MSEKDEHSPAPSYLAHHFSRPEQQFDSAKLGMWIFLATEVLFFGSLFCAYAVFRRLNPEIFEYGRRFLDTTLGGINTVILISSSFTMAWAVRCAQLGKRTGLLILLALTMVGGCCFLGVKYIEYKHKWEEGLLPGHRFHPHTGAAAGHGDQSMKTVKSQTGGEAVATGESATAGTAASATGEAGEDPAAAVTSENDDSGAAASAGPARAGTAEGDLSSATGENAASGEERTSMPPPGEAPGGLVPPGATGEVTHPTRSAPEKARIFFGIYFTLTGLHGIHVIAGIFVIGWMFIRAWQGRYGREYYTPIDMVGLYWHLVDIVWIFLFPLLYLIH